MTDDISGLSVPEAYELGRQDEATKQRAERRRFIEAMDDGRMPQAYIDKFIETGIIDGSLWPIRMPVSFHTAEDA